ncbi:FemAB family PEP-CTERM system-associated protein [Stieleria sp. TO1_6]|uniref:FemAB family XrtA/PEP-CTERM system-associated protein n=1 Tax=Stieleria tagensis TaxID=2956795 RepID=UPI00209B2A98|nr:FemAB family XrtA/PEP-CTERM system-associated protein [Stieleria tagensis]MCO8122481.1 FemAB family PEP-CTERM system-associated protein [Stieleria tagensis]
MSGVQIHSWPCEWPQIEPADLPRLAGHDPAWITALAEGLGHQVYVVTDSDGDQIVGVMPLLFVRGPIFGKFLVSLPYLNTGGVWARDQTVAGNLIDAACDLADQLGVKYLECRHEIPVEHPKFNFQRTDKVHMRLPLPDCDDALSKSFRSKLRSQVKKSASYDCQVEFGQSELLNDFYTVFAHNMRDLGTPVFSKKLFSSILNQFDGDAEICVVQHQKQPIAAGLIIHRSGVSEVPSASSLREFNRMGANMLMYRHLLSRAIERGSHTFDFGRSSESSGTYKFKAQWGAQPHPANWQYYVRDGDPNDMRPDAGGKQKLVELWQRLPVWFTKIIGPSIVRGIP